jgi:TDG/mug DNA glycosylase family protein
LGHRRAARGRPRDHEPRQPDDRDGRRTDAGRARGGAARLEALAIEYQPRIVAVVGVSAYRTAFGRPKAVVGPQSERLGNSELWVLPNPSGLNAHYQLPELAAAYRPLADAINR